MQSVNRPAAFGADGDGAMTFRLPLVGLVGVLGLVLCVTPLALAVPGLPVLYLVPLAVAVWLLRTRTVVGRAALRVHRMLRSREVCWDDVRRLRVDPRGWVRAVLDDDEEVPLPAVRARDLPRLSVASGGRIPDPSADPDSVDPDAEAEPPEPGPQ